MTTINEHIHSWNDLVSALFTQADAHRGSITLLETNPLITFPRTTGRDVFVISAMVDPFVRAHASAEVAQGWIAESELLAAEGDSLSETYVGNRSFWTTLAAVARDLDRSHTALPSREELHATMHELARERTRNTSEAKLITLLTAPTWGDMLDRQLQLFRILRGEDSGCDPAVSIVPRTTNSDVLELARYWYDQIARIGDDAEITQLRLVLSKWRIVVRRVLQYAQYGHPGDEYGHNAEFWRALTVLAGRDERDHQPAPWALDLEALAPAMRNAGEAPSSPTAPNPPTAAPPAAPGLLGLGDALGGLVNRVVDRVIDGAKRTLVAQVKPVLYAGGAVAGAVVLYLLFRPAPPSCRP